MRLRELIAAVCLPALLAAQPPSTNGAGPANGVVRTFLSFGRPYGGWLLQAFDSIPASQYAFHPTPVQQSIGFIAQHLEAANYDLCSTLGTEKHVAPILLVTDLAEHYAQLSGYMRILGLVPPSALPQPQR